MPFKPDRNVKKKADFILGRIADMMEILITVILLLAVFVFLINIVLEHFAQIQVLDFDYNKLLEQMLNLIIGIEFTRMLCTHSPNTIIDVLLFATARFVIVEHSSLLTFVAGIISISLLFVVRKYLIDTKEGHDDSREENHETEH